MTFYYMQCFYATPASGFLWWLHFKQLEQQMQAGQCLAHQAGTPGFQVQWAWNPHYRSGATWRGEDTCVKEKKTHKWKNPD